MHICSTLTVPFYGNVNDTASTSTLGYTKDEFIVLHHGGRRVLVPLPTSYEEACNIARELFLPDISSGSNTDATPTLLFETDELNISNGERIYIHRTAWEGISKALGNVHVVVKGAAVKNEIKEPSLVATVGHDANTTVRHAADSDQEDESGDERQRPSRSYGGTSSTKLAAGGAKTSKTGPVSANFASSTAGSSSLRKKGGFTPSKVRPATASEYGKGKGTKADPLNLFPDEPVKRDTESDADAEECAEVAGALERTAEPEEREEQHEGSGSGEDGVFSGVGEMKPTKSMKSSARAPPTAPAPALATAPSVANTEAPTAPTATAERILVVVDHENSDATEMKFRVRPTITVARLMQAICKQFKLEYEKIQLHMLLETEEDEEDGSTMERVYCPMDETLTTLGATEGQRFVVTEIGESD